MIIRPNPLWPRASLRSFKRICIDALFLERTGITGGLLALPPSPYPNIEAACQALAKHKIYRWLRSNLPHALERAPAASSFDHFRYFKTLAVGLALASPFKDRPYRRKNARVDKQRRSALAAIKRIEKYMDDSDCILCLPNAARHEMLEELLSEAKQVLKQRRTRSNVVKHPMLLALAQELYQRFKIADVKLILDAASALGINFDARAAQRYVRQAKQFGDT